MRELSMYEIEVVVGGVAANSGIAGAAKGAIAGAVDRLIVGMAGAVSINAAACDG